MVSDLLNAGKADGLAERNREEQERLRLAHASREWPALLTLANARDNREVVSFEDLPVPMFTGVRATQLSIMDLWAMIDWPDRGPRRPARTGSHRGRTPAAPQPLLRAVTRPHPMG